MAYSFVGVFTKADDNEVIEATKLQWPFCRIFRIHRPFQGIAIFREPKLISGSYIQSFNERDRIESELAEFSTNFPANTFIHLRTDCHGGDCTYDGFACRNGDILIDNRGKGPERIVRHIELQKLREVLKALDANLGDVGNFEPFERGFFDNEEDSIYPGII